MQKPATVHKHVTKHKHKKRKAWHCYFFTCSKSRIPNVIGLSNLTDTLKIKKNKNEISDKEISLVTWIIVLF